MNKSVQKALDRAVEAVQPHVDESVLAVVLAQRPGSYGAAAMSQLSPAAGLVRRHQGKQKARGLPLTVILALTPTHLHAFGYRQKGAWLPSRVTIKVKQHAAAWPRVGITVEAQHRRATNLLTIHGAAQPEPIQLEVASFAGGREMLDTLLAAAGWDTQPVD